MKTYFILITAVIVLSFTIFMIFVKPSIDKCEAAGGTWMDSKCVAVKEIKV